MGAPIGRLHGGNMSQHPQTDRATVRIFWQIGLRYKRLLLLSLLFPLGILLLNVLAPLFIGKALGALVLPAGEPKHYLILFAACAIAGVIANRIGHPAMNKHLAFVMRDLQSLALTTMLKRSVGFHNNNIGGKLVSDAIDYPAACSQLHMAVIGTLVPLGVTLVFGSAVIFLESWILGLYMALVVATVIGLGVYDSRRMKPRRQIRLQATKNVTAHLADTITNIQTTKTFGREAYELQRHEKLGDRLTDIRISDWSLMSLRGNNRIALLVVLQLIFTVIAITLVQNNPALLGVGIFAFTFTITLSNRLFEVNLLIRNIEDALLDASPMTKAILETPEIQDQPNAKKLQAAKGEVALQHVTFAYADAQQHDTVFKDLNLTIVPGEKIGLVGPSGGGKSTLTRLLLRFEDINSGSIAVDGQNIANVTQKSLREAISYVPQEPLLFHRSIAENIAYGQPDANKTAIKKAATLAHAHDFIEKLASGYETVVGERGVKLSGGQRQRVAIARAILKDAPILILDEATSALDSESEVLIQDALWKLMEGRTAIVIAHRLSTIQKMDRIIVLENGQITEEGTHKQLLAKKGTYAKLWSHQSGGFIEE
jgi:ATP-binding cassette, subfamily B, bacterial